MSGTLKVMSTLAVELALSRAILPAWYRDHGSVDMSWNPTGVLIEHVRGGDRGDVIIAIDAAIHSLAADGILRSDSVKAVARAAFGLAIRTGQSCPDISTVEGFKSALLSARSIAYSLAGASGIYFLEVVDRLGIAEEVKRRAITIPSGFTGEKLISGDADLAVQQISELMSVEGVDIVGPFPASLQKPTDFSAAMFSTSRRPEAALAFIEHLTSIDSARAYEIYGLASRLDDRAA